MITWKELSVSPEEEALAREIIESGAGKKLPEEKLYEFQTGEETLSGNRNKGRKNACKFLSSPGRKGEPAFVY